MVEIPRDRLQNADWFIRSKLSPPRPALQLMNRQRFDVILPKPGTAQLMLVEAPPGYGKSTLLHQWFKALKSDCQAVGWLSLDEEDQSAPLFMAYLVAALEFSGLDLPELREGAVQGFSEIPLKTALISMLTAIERFGAPVVLILDDYHRGRSKPVDDLISFLLSRQPDNMLLVIASRGLPGLHLEKLRTAGTLRRIGIEELRFTETEVAAYLGEGLPDADIRMLTLRTEGWPVALQLARLWVSRAGSLVPVMEKFSGRTTDLAAYLAEQIFIGLDEGAKDFLLKTSILDHIDGDLAKKLTGRDDAWLMLEKLVSMGLPLAAQDDHRLKYRYHQLFLEFLRDRLSRGTGIDVVALHRLAADWHARHSNFFEAARHAAEAGEVAYAARLLNEAGGWRAVLRGGLSILLKFLDLPATIYREYPQLRLAQIYLLGREGKTREARRIYDELLLETNHFILAKGRDWNPVLELESRVVGFSLDIYEGNPVQLADVELLEASLKSLPQPDPGFVSLIDHLKVIAFYDVGDFDNCRSAALKTEHDWQMLGNIPLANYLVIYRGRALFGMGRVHEAEAAFLNGLELMAGSFQEASKSGTVAPLFLAEIKYEQNDIETAHHLLQQAFSRVVEVESWFDLEISGYRTASSLELERHGANAALALIDQAEINASQRGLKLLQKYLISLRLEILVRVGLLQEAHSIVGSDDFRDQLEEDIESPWGWRTSDPARINLARFHIALGEGQQTLSVLEGFAERLERRGHGRHRLDVEIMSALGLWLLGDQQDAFQHFRTALDIATPQGLLRPFIDAGETLGSLRNDFLASRDAGPEDRMFFAIESDDQPLELDDEADETPDGLSETDILSPREREVLDFMALGLSAKEIASKLDVSESTVKTHRKNMYKKLGVHRRSSAIAKAFRGHSPV